MNDGFDEGEAMRGALDNPLFNDNFKKAFLEGKGVCGGAGADEGSDQGGG